MNTATPRIASAIARASRSAAAKQSPSQLRPLGSRIQSIRIPTSIPQSRLFSIAVARRDSSKTAPAPGTSSPAPSKAPSKIYSFEEVRPTPPSTLPRPKLTPSLRSAPTPKTQPPPPPSSSTSANPASSTPQAASPPPSTSPSPRAPTPSSSPPTSSRSALASRSREKGGGWFFTVRRV
ncbi:hypothetical protein V499_09011 [Pseudogymnoascus sp. VKM F-103]|nr:hypothetical protein V499_09011 [Pseudogymnoascus sp. VKM F-103]